jgi:ABC-type Mn2+/Zn2+ transport system ATPase subunit
VAPGEAFVSPAIDVIDMAVGFDGTAVATAGSFRLTANRLTVVTGPNGSGKTTLLKTLAGLLPPVRGRLQPQPSRGRGGAVFVHSTPYLFAGTVGHNMRLASHDAERGLRETLRSLGVDDLWTQDVNRLSTGQRQRVGIARALASEPGLLLIDEPEGGLDDAGIRSWRSLVEHALTAESPAIVIATHHLAALDGLPLHVIALAPAPARDVPAPAAVRQP